MVLKFNKCQGLSFDIDTSDLRREFLLGLVEKEDDMYLGDFQVNSY